MDFTNLLSGYGTVITGILMILSGALSFVGVQLPWVDPGTGFMLISNGFGLIFLRRAVGAVDAKVAGTS